MLTGRTAFLAFIALATGLVSSVSGGPILDSRAPGAACATIDHRKEWRDMTVDHRLAYLDAVHCLHKLPPRDPTSGATSRYEDFQATHIALADRVHFVGHFMPWHRQLVNLYIKALREECGYKGPTPYWNWSRDADAGVSFLKSPLLDPITGFGGDGVPGTYTFPPDPLGLAKLTPLPGMATSFFDGPVSVAADTPSATTSTLPPPTSTGGPVPTFPGFPTNPGAGYKGCVQDGPFAQNKWSVHLGPGKLKTTHCLVRNISPSALNVLTAANLKKAVVENESFEKFRVLVDDFRAMIHGGGHGAIGGEMTNLWSSAADPVFYLHHGGLDKVWWDWQQVNPAKRMYDVSGPTVQGGKVQVTLDFVLDFPALGANITVRDTMDSLKEPNCFVYE